MFTPTAGRYHPPVVTHDHLRMLLPRYAAGTLGRDQVEGVQSHLATGCTACLNELFRLPVGMPREASPRPPAIAPERTPTPPAPSPVGPESLAATALPNPLSRRPPGPPATAPERAPRRTAAVLAGIVIIGWSLVAWREHVRSDRAQLGSTVELLETERTAVLEMVADLHTGAGGIQSVALDAAVAKGTARGLALWNPTRTAVVLFLSGLPAPSPAAGYRAQLALANGGTTTAYFSVSPRGEALVPIRLTTPAGRLQHIEISDETTATTYLVGAPRTDATAADVRATAPIVLGTGAARR